MKRRQRNILLSIVVLVMLILLSPLVVYIPPVQQAASRYAQSWVADNTPIRLSLERFSLQFPLRIVLQNVVATTTDGDTITDAQQLQANVALVPLLRGRVVIRNISLHDAYINYITPDSTLHLQVNAGNLGVERGNIALKKKEVSIDDISLDKTQIALWYSNKVDTTTTDGKRAEWDINIANISLTDIDYTMYMPGTVDTLRATIPQAHILDGKVSLSQQSVDVATIHITKGDYRYVALDTKPRTEPDAVGIDTTTSEPWLIQVANVKLSDNKAAYITSNLPPQQGIDFSHITADNIHIDIDDIYNRGSNLQLHIADLSLHERSGLYITHTQGNFAMNDSNVMTLSDFSLKTPFSDVTADARIDLQLLDKDPDATIELLANAHIASRDIVSLFPTAQHYFLHTYNDNQWASVSDVFTLDIEASGIGKDIVVEKLNLLQPGIFTLDSRAHLINALQEHKRDITLSGRLNTTEQLSLSNYIPDSTLAARIVMQPITADADIHLVGQEIEAGAWLNCMNGIIDVDASYNMAQESYNAQATISQIPLDMFLPYDTIGNLSAHATLAGEHFSLDNPSMWIDAQLTIDTLSYKGYEYRGVEIDAVAKEEKWKLTANSRQQEAELQLDASGLYKKDLLTVDMKAQIEMLDLEALNLVKQPLDIATNITAEVVLSNIDSIVQAYIEVDSIELGIGDYVYFTNSINLLAASDITYSYIDFNTGDMSLNLSSDAGLTHLRPSLERLTQFVDTIFQKQRLNMDELHRGLPPFTFAAHIGNNNIVHRYLKSQGIGLSSASFAASNDSLFNLSALIQRLEISNIQLDTITLKAYEKENQLNYHLALNNRPGNLDKFSHVHVEGFLSGNSTQLYCLQSNRDDETGFLLGCKIDFLPELVQLTFGPSDPIIGYKKWQLNKDNYMTYRYDRHDLSADVRLSYGNSHIFATTEDRRNKDIDGAHIDIQDIELADWFTVTPFITPMSGLLSADLYVDMPEKEIEVNGKLNLNNFVYNSVKVGNFNADIDYLSDKNGGNNIDATLLCDGKNILSTTLHLDNSSPSRIGGNINIEKLPLSIANAFIPTNIGEVSGSLDSRLTLSGTLDNPNINGFIRFNDTHTLMSDYGVSLTLDNNDITVKESRIAMRNYGIRGVNKEPLNINGWIDISNMSDIRTSLDLKGKNFQPIQAAENRMATLYGSVYTDVDAQVRGSLNALKIAGDISLLSGTNATYIMQSSGINSGPDYSDMVSFVSFSDTLSSNVKEEKVKHKANMTANIDIDIDQGVQLGINLSADGNNRIDLIGGGNLQYTASALGDNHVTGRYVLTGGFVRYTPPFISQKIFNIEDGSYVLWNGNIADPSFNITAVQSQRSTVKNGDDSRLVDFEVSIIISNTLKNLDISFDLATTDDIAIQNELQGLTEEQRETKAMNMIIYNSYDNLAAAAENTFINNPLNVFLEYELNTWAQRTLRGVDLTFGIDNYGLDEAGLQRTDYSYQFSKSLFDNRLKFVIGGSYASNQDITDNLRENLIDDISLEYRLTKRDNMYLKAFRQTGYESIIEGEITQTGVGFLFRKQVNSLLDLFRKKARTTTTNDTTTNARVPETTTDSVPDVVQSQTPTDNDTL